MTLYASVIDNVSYSAGPGWRYAWGSMWDASGAVNYDADFQVTAQSTPNMSVNVAPGQAWIAGTLESPQGYYYVLSTATETVTIPAANSANPRIDLICVVVTDPAAGQTGTAGASIIDVTGTPAAAPVPPSAPPNSITVAQVAVGAGVTSITQSNITPTVGEAQMRAKFVQAFSKAQSVGPLVPPTPNGAMMDSQGLIWANTLNAGPMPFLANSTSWVFAGATTGTQVVVLGGGDFVNPPLQDILASSPGWTLSGGNLVVPYTGWYWVAGALFYQSSNDPPAASGTYCTFITVNNASVIGAVAYAPGSQWFPSVPAAGFLKLTAGQTLGLQGLVAGVTGLNVAGVWMGPFSASSTIFTLAQSSYLAAFLMAT